jgi:pyruvate formate lyase activating enzyme
MGKCINCGTESGIVSEFLGVCRNCILEDFPAVESHIQRAHQASREPFSLPFSPPRDKDGMACGYCFNNCKIGKGGAGYCGVRENRTGTQITPPPEQGFFSWYYDSLPTNCVADWACPGGTSAGFPDYSYSRGPEYGYKNLAVFYHGCTFNCLFCQNWHYREDLRDRTLHTSQELAQAVDRMTSCICYFGGDPSPQLLHSIHASRLAIERKGRKILRICWETNGGMSRRCLEEILEIALESGGCVKFDLKTFHQSLNVALCGRSNSRTKSNFELASKWIKKREDFPLVVASTLLIPGYIDKEEVFKIAEFVAGLDPNIPYALLGFHPHFYFRDVPVTSRRHAEECRQAALEAGLQNVRIGNVHLLGSDY